MAKKKEAAAPARSTTVPRLKQKYESEVIAELRNELQRENPMSLPRLVKITLNMGVGSAISEKKHLEDAVSALTQIAGQKPSVTRSKKAIAGFRLREGMPIGCKVTLRGNRMYEFMDRLISIALPRVRDFRGLSPTGFDGRGNYSMGLSEQLVFPELNPDKYTRPQGLNVTFGIKSATDDEGRLLLHKMGMPFRSETSEPAGFKKR
jgi:large subunit ribosomal protein L5